MSKFVVIGTQVHSHIDRTVCPSQTDAERHAMALLRKDRNVKIGLTELWVVQVVSTVRVAGPPIEIVPEVNEPEAA